MVKEYKNGRSSGYNSFMTRYISIALLIMMTIMMIGCGSSKEPVVIKTISQERAAELEQAEHAPGFYNKEEDVEQEPAEVIEERSKVCVKDSTAIIDSTDGITEDEKGRAYSDRAQCLFNLDNFSKEALQDWLSAAELLEDHIDKAKNYEDAAKQMHMLYLKAMKTDWSAQADRNRYAELACEQDEGYCDFYWTDNILDRYRW